MAAALCTRDVSYSIVRDMYRTSGLRTGSSSCGSTVSGDQDTHRLLREVLLAWCRSVIRILALPSSRNGLLTRFDGRTDENYCSAECQTSFPHRTQAARVSDSFRVFALGSGHRAAVLLFHSNPEIFTWLYSPWAILSVS